MIEQALRDRAELWKREAEGWRKDAGAADLAGYAGSANMRRARAVQLEICAMQLERLANVAR